jgi:hypothetical protein
MFMFRSDREPKNVEKAVRHNERIKCLIRQLGDEEDTFDPLLLVDCALIVAPFNSTISLGEKSTVIDECALHWTSGTLIC